MTRDNERATCYVESAVTVLFAFLLVFLSFDVITLFRYASSAYSIALTTARVGSVDEPGGPGMTVPLDSDLKIPGTASGYLAAWRQAIKGGSAPAFDSNILAALNLGHGWAKELLGSKFKTVVWSSAAEAASDLRQTYEFSIVPRHYQFANTTSGEIDRDLPVDYECCIAVPTILLPTKKICRSATATRYSL